MMMISSRVVRLLLRLPLLVAAVTAAVGVSVVRGEFFEGSVKTMAGVNWQLVSSFCLKEFPKGSKVRSTMDWSVHPALPSSGLVPLQSAGYTLYIYDQNPQSFPRAWATRSTATCSELAALARQALPIDWVPENGTAVTQVEEFGVDGNAGGMQFFAVVAACNRTSLQFYYKFDWDQGDKDDIHRAVSAELTELEGIQGVAFLLTGVAIVAGGLVAFLTRRVGLGLARPAVHRLLYAALVCSVGVAVAGSFWAYVLNHPEAALQATFFFQGLQQSCIMLAASLLVTANRGLLPVAGLAVATFNGLAAVQWLPYFLQSLVRAPWPGVPGALAYTNGWSILTTVIRMVALIAWIGIAAGVALATRDHGSKELSVRLRLGAFLLVVAAWLGAWPILTWMSQPQVFSCNPPALLLPFAAAVLFDGNLLVLLFVVALPSVATAVFGHVLGAGTRPGGLDLVSFWRWHLIDWDPRLGAASARADAGLAPAVAPGTAAGATAKTPLVTGGGSAHEQHSAL